MLATLTHPKHHVMAGPTYIHPAKPLRASDLFLRWRLQRACRKRGGHWWHPYTELDWFCCQCGAERDGMPKDGP